MAGVHRFSRAFYLGSLVFVVALLLPAVISARLMSVQAVVPAATTCIDWNIQGAWQYRASGGGYGTLDFLQNASGALSGTWHNVAQGSSGNIAGQITGASVVWGDAGSSTNLQATVAPTGLKMAGTYTSPQGNGTWEATGAAQCLRWASPPPAGSAQAIVQWGEYIYHVALPAGSNVAAMPVQTSQPPTITFLGDVSLDIRVIIYDTNPPANLQVVERVDGGARRALGTLARVGPSPDGGTIYQGRVTVRPIAPIGVGKTESHEVIVVDPQDREWRVTRVQMYLIDPSGYIYDTASDARIEGAMVSLYQWQGGAWVLWNAAQYLQTNPQVTDAQGRYGWEAPEGDYQVRVSKRCYTTAQSASIHIPPPRTDVNLGLPPVTCSSLTLTDIWTANTAGTVKADFAPGATVAAHVPVTSTATQDVTVAAAWIVTDPAGQKVNALSGSGTYIVAPFGAELTFAGALPVSAAPGVYRFGLEIVDQGQTLYKGTTFEVLSPRLNFLPVVLKAPTPTPTPTPTTTPTPTPTSTPQPGIYGRITQGLAPAANVSLQLRFWNGQSWISIAQTITDSGGGYRFTDIASLGSGQMYYVLYGPNSTDSNRVYAWYGPDIKTYTAGTAQAGGNFDIANVSLLSPGSGAVVTLPVDFTWQVRNVPGDQYGWALFDLTSDDGWYTGPMGAVGSFTMQVMPTGGLYNHAYGWAVEIYAAPDSYGQSYYYRQVTFAGAAAAASPSSALSRMPFADKRLLR